MTHEPPVPPDNQSPYPIAEPPHEHAEPSESEAEGLTGSPRILLIGGAVAAAGLAAIGGLAAVLLRRRGKTIPKPKPAAKAKRKK